MLRDAGVTCQEYTLTSEGALDALVRTRKTLGDLVLGVGSVRTIDDLRAAADAGADLPAISAVAASMMPVSAFGWPATSAGAATAGTMVPGAGARTRGRCRYRL